MSNEPQEFEQLRKLLQLKRYEQPPPRFFNEFSSRVLDGIASEAARSPANPFVAATSWLSDFFRALERNALVAGGLVTGVCAALIGGIVYSEYVVDGIAADAGSAPDRTVMVEPTRTAQIIPVGFHPTYGSSLDAVFSPSNSLPEDSLFDRVAPPTATKMIWKVVPE